MTDHGTTLPASPLSSAEPVQAADTLSLDRLDAFSYRLIAMGFVLLTLVIITGALWAQATWHRWWSWDPKETSALVAWLVYLVYLHGRLSGWAKKRTAWIAVLGAFSVLFCYVGVNFFQGLHSYGAPSFRGARSIFRGMGSGEALFTKSFLVAYLVAFLAYLATTAVARRVRSKALFLAGTVPAAIGLALHTGALAQRAVLAGHLPFSSGYEYAASFAWAMVLVLLVVQVRLRSPVLGLWSMVLVFLILAYGFTAFPDKSIAPLPVALQNVFWLHVHVAIAIVSYASLLLATATSGLYLYRSWRAGDQDDGLVEEAAELKGRAAGPGRLAAAATLGQTRCENCGAEIDESAVSERAGRVVVKCPYCGASYGAGRAEQP